MSGEGKVGTLLRRRAALPLASKGVQVGEQFGRGGSPMDGNPGKLLMRE